MMYHYQASKDNASAAASAAGNLAASGPDALLLSGAPWSYCHYSQPQEEAPEEHQQQRTAAAVSAVTVSRYSVEERRERIDKYRSKRSQRNFQKKITYACTKTLADSRPRVKGRFARNDADVDAGASDQGASAGMIMVDQLESPAANYDADHAMPEWCYSPEMSATGIHDHSTLPDATDDDDEMMLAAFLGVSSINLSSYYSPSCSDK